VKSSFTDVTRYEYGPTKHDAIYGFDPDRWLASGYMGHLPCFPFYGPPSSEDEVRAVLGNHGQAPIVEWAKTGAEVRDDGVTLRYGATLDKTQYRVQRAVTHPK
jgi:hypothetical protein